MRRRANPTRSKVDLARISFRIGDELGEVVGWKCRIDVHHVGQSHYAGDRDAVADEIKRKLLVEPGVNGVVRADEGDCVAIGAELSADCMPTLPAAPARFSMTNCCPR